jgi:hypothetical protein
MARPFLAEILEISEDLCAETQYVHTFWDDPEVRDKVEQMIVAAYGAAQDNARRAHRDADSAAFQAGLMLLTYGFYLGREHARRGYPAPIQPGDLDSGFVPDSPAGLE